jgi:hypothetical protein
MLGPVLKLWGVLWWLLSTMLTTLMAVLMVAVRALSVVMLSKMGKSAEVRQTSVCSHAFTQKTTF